MADDLLLIDTDVLIDFSRDVEKTKKKLKKYESEHTLAISVITQLELMVGSVRIKRTSKIYKNSSKTLKSSN